MVQSRSMNERHELEHAVEEGEKKRQKARQQEEDRKFHDQVAVRMLSDLLRISKGMMPHGNLASQAFSIADKMLLERRKRSNLDAIE